MNWKKAFLNIFPTVTINNVVILKIEYNNNKKHNESGPAIIEYYQNCNKQNEAYYY
jgi:hypothetical protein